MHQTVSKPPSCLIVDDDPIFVAMLEQALKNRGLEQIYTAFDGVQSLDVVKQNAGKIQTITLDLNMPNEDGIGFLTSVSKLNFEGEIFLCSSEHKNVLDSALQLARMLGLKCTETFAKPINFDALADRVMNTRNAAHDICKKRTDKAAIDFALSELQIEAFYQARLNLSSLTITGAEVLARIKDHRGNYLNTQEVIDHAERTGKIADLTWKMLDNMVKGARILNRPGTRHPVLSVNINGLLMASTGFSASLIEFFNHADINPNRIVLEITETGLPPDPAAALEAFTRLRMHGFGIAIDDFGTGYSNIENLKLFPFTELKIDKGFISNAQNDAFSRECIAASVRLANELGLRVVAEGVETEYDLHLVKSFNIDEAQGYLFARPMPLTDFADFYGGQTNLAIPGIKEFDQLKA